MIFVNCLFFRKKNIFQISIAQIVLIAFIFWFCGQDDGNVAAIKNRMRLYRLFYIQGGQFTIWGKFKVDDIECGAIFMAKIMMAGMILREPENGKKYGGRVDMGMTMMECS